MRQRYSLRQPHRDQTLNHVSPDFGRRVFKQAGKSRKETGLPGVRLELFQLAERVKRGTGMCAPKPCTQLSEANGVQGNGGAIAKAALDERLAKNLWIVR